MLFASDDVKEISSEISTRIKLLNDMSEADLKNEMRELKQALKDNPSACALLMDEDIGMLVSSLRRLTKKDIEQVETKPRKTKEKAPVVKLSAIDLAAALDDEDF